MKFWVFQNNQVTGPYHPDDLTQVPGYGGETLVCPEGRRGTNMGDWQRASMVPELSLSIIKSGQLAVALKGSGGYGGLPPEPTLKDLAALGSLQEKVSLLDNTVSHLQESLRLKEEELLSVHKELEDKTKYAQEMSVKLGGLEERFTAVNQLREGLDKAVEAEHDVESTVSQQSRLIEDLSTQLKALRDEQRQMDELREELSKVKAQQQQAQEETARKLDEARAAAEEAAQKAVEAKAKADEAAAKPAAGAPGLRPEPSVSDRLGLPSERLAPSGLGGPAALSPLGESKPLEPLGGAAPLDPLGGAPVNPLGGAPLNPLGGAAPLDPLVIPGAPEPSSAPSPLEAPSDPALAAVLAGAAGQGANVVPEPAPAAAKSKKPLVLVAVAVLAVGALGAFKLGLLGGKKKAAPPVEMPAPPMADKTPLPPPASPEATNTQPPTPEQLAEQEKQQAIDLVKGWALPSGAMVGATLEAQAPQAPGGLTPWFADGKAGKYQVNFYGPKKDSAPALTFEFDVALADKKVAAHNKAAQALLAGKPIQAERPKRKVKSLKAERNPKIRPKKAAAGDDSGLLSDLLSVDENAAKPKAKNAPKAAGGEAAAPGDGGGDVLIDGSGHDAQPQTVASKPLRKAPPKRAEKRNVDKELNDLLSDDQGKPAAQKAAAPKQQSLDELLEPGGARPGDAAPTAEPAAPSESDSSAPPQKGAEATMPPAEGDSADTASAEPAKPAPKAKKKGGQPADAELLDDLLK